MLLIKLAFLSVLAASSMVLRPQDPFTDKYDKASDIVMGTFSEAGSTNVSLDILKRFPRGFIKKGKVKIEKSWKGKSKGSVEFYYAVNGSGLKNPNDLAMTARNVRNGLPMIFFLREENGKKVAAYRFGLAVSSDLKKLQGHPFYKALEAIKAGVSVEEAAKIGDVGALVRKEAE